jgi:hypothetical protein
MRPRVWRLIVEEQVRLSNGSRVEPLVLVLQKACLLSGITGYALTETFLSSTLRPSDSAIVVTRGCFASLTVKIIPSITRMFVRISYK